MSSHVRRSVVALVLLGLLGLAGASSSTNAAPAPAQADTYPPTPVYTYPTNAAKVFRWGVEAWKDEFEVNPLRGDWATSAGGDVVTRNGMLTLMAYPGSGTVTATPTSQKAKLGRWEARVRVWEKDRSAGTPYRVFWELVPNKKYRCGSKSIEIASYSQDELQVTGAVRTRPANEFTFSRVLPLTQGWFHTFAVEVTDDHISWFVDKVVVHTERRTEALSNTTFRPQFRMQAVDGASMRPTWMQMDWVRYYTLDRPGALPIEAPEMTQGTYAGAC
ncbi:family 16 glycosylhydrolase [Nocardioides sp.]|uniref:family 16 glycosylhydrolase n=1 Tax=Nocardioides sp. TaxID=35761 RepID=UPI001A301EEB|nr:family 16 glycosylhydrolase [Nocardioides sp.]MBJ7359040.1 family 16 glycosylhydrolase [Nocardioides sp.]